MSHGCRRDSGDFEAEWLAVLGRAEFDTGAGGAFAEPKFVPVVRRDPAREMPGGIGHGFADRGCCRDGVPDKDVEVEAMDPDGNSGRWRAVGMVNLTVEFRAAEAGLQREAAGESAHTMARRQRGEREGGGQCDGHDPATRLEGAGWRQPA